MLIHEIVLYPDGRVVFECDGFTVKGTWGHYVQDDGKDVYQFVFDQYEPNMFTIAEHLKNLDDDAFEELLNDVGVQ